MNRKLRKIAALLFALSFSLGLIAAGNADGESAVKIGFTAMNLTDPFQITIADQVKELAAEKGWEFMSGDGNGDNEKQVELINDMITAGITHLVLCPVSQDGILPALMACKEAGVVVVNYDSMVTDKDLTAAYIASDNYTAGKQVGEWLVANYPNGGEMAVINNPLAESVVQRVKGLYDAIEGSKITVVADDAITTLGEVLTKAEDALTANPGLDFYFGLNDSCGLIALGAVQSAGMDVVCVSVDGSPDGKASIVDGGLKATAGQSPKAIGKKVFEVIEQLVAGQELEQKEFYIDTILITAENVEQYGVNGWQ